MFTTGLMLTLAMAAAAGHPEAAGRHADGIVMAISQQGLEQAAPFPSFDLMRLRDLWVRLQVQRMPKTARLDLVFTSPRGEAFYQTSLFFSRDPKLTSMSIAGSDHAVTVFPARKVAGGYALDQVVPIAGSVFTRYPIPGTWVVQATVSGLSDTFTATMDLEVTP
jgi:hypothetical protein